MILSSLANGGVIGTRTVFHAIALGDSVASQFVDDAIRFICINLGGLVNLLDVSLIVMGGGVTEAAPWFVERVDSGIRAYLMTAEAKRDLQVKRPVHAQCGVMGRRRACFRG